MVVIRVNPEKESSPKNKLELKNNSGKLAKYQ